MEGLVGSRINHPAVEPSPAPVPAAQPVLQVAEIMMGNSSNEVAACAMVIKQISIEQNLERK